MSFFVLFFRQDRFTPVQFHFKFQLCSLHKFVSGISKYVELCQRMETISFQVKDQQEAEKKKVTSTEIQAALNVCDIKSVLT